MTPLVPFSKTELNSQFQITAQILSMEASSNSMELIIAYHVSGPIGQLVFPSATSENSRRDELWKHTCFEAFLSTDLDSNTAYTEINCSADGHWNSYDFDGYRKGMRPSPVQVQLIDKEISPTSACFKVAISDADLQNKKYLGITMVVEFLDGSKSYFAIKHAGSQPDFHLKESFNISL
jgi:hypothetical protein